MQRFPYGFPTFAYDGAKARLAKDFIKYLPSEGRLLVDLFAGRGNFFWAVTSLAGSRFKRFLINDHQTGPWFESILSHAHKVRIPSDPDEIRQEFTRIRLKIKANGGDYDTLSPVERLLEPHLSFGGRGYVGGGPASTGNASPEAFRQAILRAQEILEETGARITSYNWTQLQAYLRKLTWDDVVYLDPPYFGCSVHSYPAWSLDQCTELVHFLRDVPFKWMLSEYRQPFYIKAFGEPVYVRDINCVTANDGSRRRECFWTNYSK